MVDDYSSVLVWSHFLVSVRLLPMFAIIDHNEESDQLLSHCLTLDRWFAVQTHNLYLCLDVLAYTLFNKFSWGIYTIHNCACIYMNFKPIKDNIIFLCTR